MFRALEGDRHLFIPTINFTGLKRTFLGVSSEQTIPVDIVTPQKPQETQAPLPPAVVLDAQGAISPEDAGAVDMLGRQGALRRLEYGVVPPTESNNHLGIIANLAAAKAPTPDETQKKNLHGHTRVGIPMEDIVSYTDTSAEEVREMVRATPIVSIEEMPLPDKIKPEPKTEVLVVKAADLVKAARDEAEKHLLHPENQIAAD